MIQGGDKDFLQYSNTFVHFYYFVLSCFGTLVLLPTSPVVRFGENVLGAMSEMNRVLDKDDDMATTIKKVKAAMADGKLEKLQALRKKRAVLQERAKSGEEERLASAKTRLKEIGIDVDADGMDETYRKLKQAIDRGDLTKLASKAAADNGGVAGSLWGGGDYDGPW